MHWHQLAHPTRFSKTLTDSDGTPSPTSFTLRDLGLHVTETAVTQGDAFTVVRVGPMPPAGWKIHVSTTFDNAAETLRRVATECLELQTSFKFTKSVEMLQFINGPAAARSASGKFITIYPTETTLSPIVDRLRSALAGLCPGPRILTDYPVRDTCSVYARFGEFSSWRLPDLTNTNRPYVSLNDGAELREEVRGLADPKEALPANAPDFLIHVPNTRSTMLSDFTSITAARLTAHGGVYIATRPDGTKIVIKERRHGLGTTFTEQAAETQLRREYATMLELRGKIPVAEPLAFRTEGGSSFILMEHLDGTSPFHWATSTNPLVELGRRAHPGAWDTYWQRTQPALASLVTSCAKLAELGMVFGDVSPGNIVFAHDGQTAHLIDLATVTPSGELRCATSTPGYTCPEVARELPRSIPAHQAQDVYAIGCVIADVLLPGPHTSAYASGLGSAASMFARRMHGAGFAPMVGRYLMDAVCRSLSPTAEDRPTFDELLTTLTASACTRGTSSTSRSAGVAAPKHPHGCESTSTQHLQALTEGFVERGRRNALSITDPLARQLPFMYGPYGSEVVFRAHVGDDLLCTSRPTLPANPPPGLWSGLAGVVSAQICPQPPAAFSALAEQTSAVRETFWHRYAASRTNARLNWAVGAAGVSAALQTYSIAVGDETPVENLDLMSLVLTSTVDPTDLSFATGEVGKALGLVYFAAEPAWRDTIDERISHVLDQALRTLRFRDGVATGAVLGGPKTTRCSPYLSDGSAGIAVLLSALHRLTGQDIFATGARSVLSGTDALVPVQCGLLSGHLGLMAARLEAGLTASEIERRQLIPFIPDRHTTLLGEQNFWPDDSLGGGTAGALLVLGSAPALAEPVFNGLVAPVLLFSRRPTMPRTEGTVERYVREFGATVRGPKSC